MGRQPLLFIPYDSRHRDVVRGTSLSGGAAARRSGYALSVHRRSANGEPAIRRGRRLPVGVREGGVRRAAVVSAP